MYIRGAIEESQTASKQSKETTDKTRKNLNIPNYSNIHNWNTKTRILSTGAKYAYNWLCTYKWVSSGGQPWQCRIPHLVQGFPSHLPCLKGNFQYVALVGNELVWRRDRVAKTWDLARFELNISGDSTNKSCTARTRQLRNTKAHLGI